MIILGKLEVKKTITILDFLLRPGISGQNRIESFFTKRRQILDILLEVED